MPSLLRRPTLEWAAGQRTTVRLTPLTLPAGRVVGDFTAFSLRIREDPEWPRSGESAAAADAADPIADDWASVVLAAGSLVSSVPTFVFTMPSPAGIERYAVDAFGLIGADEIQLLRAYWLTCGARVV